MKATSSYIADRSREYLQAPRLSAARERELLARWKDDRDEEARSLLIEANMRHVVAIARKFQRYPISFGDLVSEGSLGLVIAIDRFDPDKNVRLVTYASYWIRACIFQAVIKEWKRGKTGLGMTRSKTFFKIRRIRAIHMARYGDEHCHLDEMARELEVSVENLREMLDLLETHDLSMDADWTFDGERAGGMHEKLAFEGQGPDHLATHNEDRARVRGLIERAMDCLDERERFVASSRLLENDPRTLAELGRTMGVSRERARQIEVRAREKLDRALRRQGVNKNNVSTWI